MITYSTLFFDLDDTIYPASSGLWSAIKARIVTYMIERLRIPAEQVPILRQEYVEKYGTTLRGLETHYTLDKRAFLAYVHDLPLGNYIIPDPELRTVLQAIPTRKVIFTNADAPHAERVMDYLGVRDCFEMIIDIHAMHPYCKPMPEAFQLAMRLAGETDATRCIMLDDGPRTTRAAKALGMYSILVAEQAVPAADHSHSIISHWRELPSVLMPILESR